MKSGVSQQNQLPRGIGILAGVVGLEANATRQVST
jgi:hypothetical protein